MLPGDSPLFHDDVLYQFRLFSFARPFVRATNPGARGIFSRFAPGGPDTFIPVDEQSLAYSSVKQSSRILLAATCVSGNARRVVSWEGKRLRTIAELLSLRKASSYRYRDIRFVKYFPLASFCFLLFSFEVNQSGHTTNESFKRPQQ